MSERKHSHYFKFWNGAIDIYRLCELFEVKRKPIDHAIKKLLCAGSRGAKDELKDYQEAIDSINRAIEMIKEDQAASYCDPHKTTDIAVANAKKEFSRIDAIGQNGGDGLHYQGAK